MAPGVTWIQDDRGSFGCAMSQGGPDKPLTRELHLNIEENKQMDQEKWFVALLCSQIC